MQASRWTVAKGIVQGLGAYALVAACGTLAGWAFEIRRLTSWDNNISQMPNNAIAVAAAGAALICWTLGKRRATAILGAFTGLIGLATLFEHLSGINLGIDTLVFHREWGQSGTLSPGRMGLPASIALGVVGTALVLRCFRRTERFATTGGLFALGITLLSLIGYLFDASRLYALPRLTTIAFQTSSMIFALGAGLVAAVPGRAPMKTLLGDSAASLLVRRALPGLLLLPMLVGWLTLRGQRAGLFDPAFGTAALVLILIGLLAALLWWSAAAISAHEAALRESNDKFSLLFEKAAFGAALVRWPGGGVVDVNEAFEKMFGRSAAAIDLEPLVREGSLRDHEMKHDGRTFLTNATTIELRGEPHVLVTVQDVTAQKMVEDALRAADRMKDEFLATLSHELRTPLTSIIGWSHMLLRDELADAEKRMALEAIRSSARAQAQLTEDLLDVSRIITGKVSLAREPVVLAEVVEAAVAAIRPAAEARNIPLEAEIDPALPEAFVDRERIQQVVWNLLSNAIKFSPRGSPVRVILRGDAEKSVIEVIDRGHGIRGDFLPHIFERFRQADSSSKRAESGLGLGLALVKDLVELHGGTVDVESEEGRGSRFTVQLPLAPAPPGAHRSADAPSHAPAGSPLAGMRVLYVDDREDARVLIGRMLGQEGAEVVHAGSADEALAALSRARPDVVLTDLAMPERDGYDLLAMIRSDRRWNDVPVLALTAQGHMDEDRRAAAAGFQAFLRKPIEPHDLTAALMRVTAPR